MQKKGCTILIATPIVLLLLIHVLFMRLPVHLRHPISVHILVTDENGTPMPDVEFTYYEQGIRGFVPIPFSPSWTIYSSEKTMNSDENGRLVLKFKEDHLKVDRIKLKSKVVSEHTSIHHFWTGRNIERRHSSSHKYALSETYGIASKAEDPYRRDYTVRILETKTYEN